jgi:glycosyltransferase involved in cell wall biosynthesis
MTGKPRCNPSVLFAVTEDWYFWSHRKPLAEFLQHNGCAVTVATRFSRFEARLREAGFDCIAVRFERSLRHPVRDALAVVQLWRAIRRAKPDVVHLVSLKPILLSALALVCERRIRFVAAFTGMGYLFSSSDRRAHWYRRGVVALLRVLLRRRTCWIIVQNEDDRALLQAERLGDPARTLLIRGVGVDVDAFSFRDEPADGPPVVVLPARLIRDKGIEEFVAAARLLKRRSVDVRCVLAGADDPDNPAAIARATIESWVTAGIVEWWGHRDDMPAVYHAAHIVCLPSYREGLPKVLIEAAACGCPLIATDVAGCREVCRDGVNGKLVPPRSAAALADAIEELVAAPELRRRYGAAGRQLVETEFALDRIGRETLACYARVLGAEPA